MLYLIGGDRAKTVSVDAVNNLFLIIWITIEGHMMQMLLYKEQGITVSHRFDFEKKKGGLDFVD